jgi:hypothetical protein
VKVEDRISYSNRDVQNSYGMIKCDTLSIEEVKQIEAARKDGYKKSYLWTYDLYGPVRHAFDVGKSITRASGRGLGPGNGIEPLEGDQFSRYTVYSQLGKVTIKFLISRIEFYV